MDKRYQVFISSTYTDLQDERRSVIEAVLDHSCIPAGMELFPAADEEQFSYITRVIDDSDYYVVIIAARYGSTTADGISYTEKEYEYAVSRRLTVLPFIHESPGSIAYDKSETDPSLRKRLEAFKQKVSANRLRKTWNNAEDLKYKVSASLGAAIREGRAIGWVRADKPAAADVLAEINELRKRNADLEHDVKEFQNQLSPKVNDIAGLDEKIELHGNNQRNPIYAICPTAWKGRFTWRAIFGYIAPYLWEFPNRERVKRVLEGELFRVSGAIGLEPRMDDQDFQTVSVQLKALGLIDVQYATAVGGGTGLFWSLTPSGEKLLLEVRTIRTAAEG